MESKSKIKRIIVLLLFVFLCVSFVDVFANVHAYSNNEQSITVTVVSGETIWNIASRFNNNKEDIREFAYKIRKINNLNKNADIYPGQTIRVPFRD